MFAITQINDTFIDCLVHISEKNGISVDPSYYFGTTGHGARFTLSMNVKRNKFIGHPSSIYSWDIISVVEHCFPHSGIKTKLYVGPGYYNPARRTAAQTSREIPENTIVLDDYTLPEISGDLIVAHPDGKWIVTDTTTKLDVDTSIMPFGPVILKILSVNEPEYIFPRSTLEYLVSTIERGEEPMEVSGKDNLNAVSGWKAYARWMQSFAIPLPNVQHEFLSKLPPLVLERRKNFAVYLNNLAENLDGKERSLITNLAEKYQEIVPTLKDIVENGMSKERVRKAYFSEQNTQKIYKKLDTYLTHEIDR